jgi:hypothetical protein
MTMPPATPAPKKLEPQQIADLSPEARHQYFRDQANAGVHDPGLFGVVERLVAQAKANQDAEKVGDDNVKTLENQDVTYVQGLSPSDADYLGHEHEQLKAYLDTNLDPAQVTEVSNAYHSLHQAFDGFGTTMTEAVNKSKGEWEGDAAGAAQGYFTSLSSWADANSTNAKLASETIYDQQTAASSAKNTMPEPIKFDMMNEMAKWTQAKDPVSFASAISDTYKTYDASQKAHEEAAGVMAQYDKSLYAAASKQPAFAPPPQFGEGSIGIITPPIGPDNNTVRRVGDDLRNSGTGDPSGPNGTDATLKSGTYGTGGGDTSSGTVRGTGDPLPLSRLQPGVHTTGAGTLPGHTTPSSVQSTNLPPATSSSQNANSGFGGMSPMPMGAMGGGGFGGVGAGSEYSNKLGRGGGFGPGSGGSGSGGSSTPGAGSGSGARAGGIGAAEAAAGRGIGAGGSGAGGRPGSGMGGMGRGRGSEGEEDLEHQRPDYLVEADPDEFFGTDVRTAPPVIGE